MKIKQFYQGDVPILKNVYLPKEKLIWKKLNSKGLTVALGEVTGHHHTIYPKTQTAEISYTEYLNNWYMRIDKGEAEITHQEHDTITLTPGVYFIGKQYEYSDLEEYQKVKD